jgi:hypothetical protein
MDEARGFAEDLLEIGGEFCEEPFEARKDAHVKLL